MIRAFCFDMDGVLFDTERLGEQLIVEIIARQGFAITQEQYRSVIGTSWPHTYECLCRWFPGFDAARFEREWKNETFVPYFKAHGVPYKPGAREVLADLKARGFRLALVTSNLPDVVAMYLDLAGWSDIFDFVVTADQVAQSKPAPDIYLRAADLLGVSPAECVGIEDSPSGVRAIRAAGMTCVMVPDLAPFSDALAPYVDVVLPDLTGLIPAVLAREPHA